MGIPFAWAPGFIPKNITIDYFAPPAKLTYVVPNPTDISDSAMQAALQLHQAGKLEAAENLYRDILSRDPNHADALRLLGMIALQQGRAGDATELIQRSLSIDPNKPESHHNLGDALRSAGKLDAAVDAYARAAQLRPDWAEAHGALGNALLDQQKPALAAEAYSQAIRLKPALPIGYLNLGKALHELSRRDDAKAAFLKAIELRPDWPEAYNHLGNVLWDEKNLDDAAAAYAKAVALKPDYPAANWSLGNVLNLKRDLPAAIACFERVLRFHPTLAEAHVKLAGILAKAGRRDEACESYREAIRLKPGNPEWHFKLAALSSDGSVSTTPASYIKDLFNIYAPNFDQHLVEQLDYRTPERLLEAVTAITSRDNLEILDLGCGTGLCGAQFRKLARKLVGVDLAPKMIEAARARGIYDELITGELKQALAEPGQYDLIVAGDVLIYVGAVHELLPAVARSLRRGGYFAFSIENHEGEGFFLHPAERFAHSIEYIRDRATRAGLSEISTMQIALRKQAGGDVPGSIIVLGKK
jgi:predicted TPR repeat methyltransferase